MKGKNANSTLNYSIAMKGGKVIGVESSDNRGSPSNFITRKYKTHIGCYQSCSRHSEAVLLSRLPKSLISNSKKISKVKIINIRIFKDGSLGSSCCCLDCAKLLFNVGIRLCIYINDFGVFIKDDIKNVLTYAKRSRGAGRYLT